MSGRTSASVARTVRRLPGYSAVSAPVVRAIRSSPLLVDLASRLFPPRFDLARSVFPFRAGVLTGGDVTRLPLIGFLLLGSDEDTAAALVHEVARLQERTLAFRPVLIVDGPFFSSAREADMVMEHIVPAHEWRGAVAGTTTHARYLARRLLDLQRDYSAVHICVVHSDGIDALDRQVLTDLADALPADLQVTRLERPGAADSQGAGPTG